MTADSEALGRTRPPDGRAALATGSRAVRRFSLRAQLVLFSVLLVLVAAGGSAAAGWQIVEGLIQQGATDRLNAAAATFASLYNQRAADAELVARQLSERATLVQAINQRSGERLAALIEPVQTLRPYYSIAVADREGNVIAKLIPPGRPDPGPSLLDVPGAREALELGSPLSPILLRRPECSMVVAVNAPVKAATGIVVGLVHLRFLLDDDLVRQVKSDTNMDLSLYCGDQLVATSLPVPGSSLKPNAEAIRHVLEEGSSWEENLRAANLTYRTRYVPLLGSDGDPVGMYGVAIPVQTLAGARYAILRFFLPVMAAIAGLAMLIGYGGAAVLTTPLRRLAAAAARIGGGDLDSPVEAEGEDEVAQLADRMEEMRRSLSQTYTQLRELNELKDEYPFSVAHEVRTPLTSLLASVEVLASDRSEMSAEEMGATIRRIARSALRLQTLVENVLDAGSIRAGRFTIAPGPLDLRATAESAASTLQPLLEEKRQRIDLAVSDDLPAVLADERRVAQVLANLLSNASKYGPTGDRIAVRAAVRDGEMLVRVSDHGPGVPLPEQGELFERYFRAANNLHSSPGTGLGLSISKAIVEAHGGSIGLESEPNRGTTVWFTLPLATQEQRLPERQAVAV